MVENPQNSINPIVLPIESVETASRNFLVNDRKTLRITKIKKLVFETLTKNAWHPNKNEVFEGTQVFVRVSGIFCQVFILRQDPRIQR